MEMDRSWETIIQGFFLPQNVIEAIVNLLCSAITKIKNTRAKEDVSPYITLPSFSSFIFPSTCRIYAWINLLKSP